MWGICQSEDLKSAVVVGLPHNSLKNLPHLGGVSFWLTVWTGISDPELVFGFHSAYGLWVLGEPNTARVHLGATTFPSSIRVIGYSAVQQQSPIRRDPSASRNTFSVSTITDGYARLGRVLPNTLDLRRPDCTSSRLFALVAKEYDRLVTQSMATPEPGCPDPHPRSSRSLLRP